MSSLPNLVGISGSLREHSFCTAVLRTIAEQLEGQATLEVLSLATLPLYNQDLDGGAPPASVAALRRAIGDAAGLVIVTPEYNYVIPGVLKNALDWASRPYGQSRLTGRPVLTMSASPAFTGGVRAQSQLNDTLIANAAILVPQPQIAIGLVHDKVTDGRLVDEATLQFIAGGLSDLLRMS